MRCVYPDCQSTRRTRGLCHGHYQVMRDRVRRAEKRRDGAGLELELDLERRGLLMKKGTAGGPQAGDPLKAFELGSAVLGKEELGKEVIRRAGRS